jgi:hypothetical protein
VGNCGAQNLNTFPDASDTVSFGSGGAGK